ncbi:MAG: ferrous iron transporter B [Firmicutes bacterium]|nr:ferrous iron transporter B [Bacillota bacterium]
MQGAVKSRGDQFRDEIVSTIYQQAESIAAEVVSQSKEEGPSWDDRIDDILTSRTFGYPLMLALLGGIFWLTITGANYPSQLLSDFLFAIEARLSLVFRALSAPEWLQGLLLSGTYRGLAWVVSVMLPPMAIFFPLFTLLEDLGYLPRVAFNLDGFFKRAGTHGKQALTMAMGFGCNAAGVVAARIIDSPRERMIAIITNNFVPCNGRFPLLISLSAIFLGGQVVGAYGNALASLVVVALVLVGITVTLLVSWALSKTLLRGVPSSFSLELPPYRPPQIGRVLVRSIFDRTLFVLRRAIMVAAPAGAITWILANSYVGELSVLAHAARWLEPFGRALGLDGYIILAFLLGLPANEIVIPILIMSYLGAGAMLELDSIEAMRQLFLANGWTWLTALNTMLFSLLHFPCGTTLLVIGRETGHIKWPALTFAITTGIASTVCFVIAQAAGFLGLV